MPYARFILPGLVMLGVVTNAYLNSASSLFVMKLQGTVVDLLVSPLSYAEILGAFVAAAVARGLLVGGIMWIVGALFTGFGVAHPLLAAAAPRGGGRRASPRSGFLTATWAASFEQVNFLPTFVVTPLTFLGGVFYSASMAPPALRWLTRANPIYYLVEALRWSVLGSAGRASGGGLRRRWRCWPRGALAGRLRGAPERLAPPGLIRRHFGIYFGPSLVILRPPFKAQFSWRFPDASRSRRSARAGRHGVQEVRCARRRRRPAAAGRPPQPRPAACAGKVVERIDAAPYSYLRIAGPAGEIWAAVPQAAIENGTEVVIENPMPMDGFESKTLNRKFDKIFFGTLGGQGGAPRRGSGRRCPQPDAPAGMPPGAMPPGGMPPGGHGRPARRRRRGPDRRRRREGPQGHRRRTPRPSPRSTPRRPSSRRRRSRSAARS